MTTLNQVADVLDAAADLIEPEGAWTQGRFGSREAGCYCIMGALHQVRWDTGTPFDACVVPAGQFLREFLDKEPAVWNDAEGRTQTEVVETLRKAAQSARKDSE